MADEYIDKEQLGYLWSRIQQLPQIGEKNVQSDWNVTDTNADDYIKNKPTIATPRDVGIRHVAIYLGAGDIKSVTDYLYNQKVALSLDATYGVTCRCDVASNSVFGTASFQAFGWFSSANYGFGFLVSDNNANIAVFRRSSGTNYVSILQANTNAIVNVTPLSGSNYSNYGNTYYYKVGSRVHVHVGVNGLTPNTTQHIVQLPTGYRPRTRQALVGVGGAYGASNVVTGAVYADGYVDVYSNSQYAIVDVEFDTF